MQIVANNKKAFFEYFILEKIEAGIQLTGDEVKSLRVGKASIKEAYAEAKKGQLFLVNSDISNYEKASSYSKLNSKRLSKLLFHKKGIAKVEIAVAKGKKLYDKREVKKKKDWNMQKKRLLKNIN